MVEIRVSDEMRRLWPGTALGILSYKAKVAASPAELIEHFETEIGRLAREYTLEAVAKNPHIAAARQAYKALGKSPQAYRNAAEAMLRRIAKQSGLYHINNVVEVNNLISITSGYSIGSYDVNCLDGAVVLRRAEDGSHYDGIGKDSVNIEHLPVLFDEKGPFGNPTSDSRRAMIREGERDVLSVIYSFDGQEELGRWMDEFSRLLMQYCGAEEIETRIV